VILKLEVCVWRRKRYLWIDFNNPQILSLANSNFS